MDGLSSAQGWQASRCLLPRVLNMAHPLTVEIKSAIYSFDTPIFPYWFMGIQVMSRMFSYEVQRWNKCLKTHDRRSLSVSPKFFPRSPSLMACLTLLVQCVCSCYGMWCHVLSSHVPRVSHSLHLLHLSPSIQATVLTEEKYKQNIFRYLALNERKLWETSQNQFILVCPNSGLYQHNRSHAIIKASCVHI